MFRRKRAQMTDDIHTEPVQSTNMRAGAIWACALPITLGVIGIILLIPTVSPLPWGKAFIGPLYFIILPILACFSLGSPLAAWLACRQLHKISDVEKIWWWQTSAWQGLKAATWVHFIAALFYSLAFAIYFLLESKTPGSNLSQFATLLLTSAMINLCLWVIITLPLSLVCATIFWRVAKLPEDTSVF